MKRFYLVTTLFFLCCFGLISCENEEFQSEQGNEFIGKTSTSVSPANSANAYDYVGENHNSLLKSCREEIMSIYKNKGDITLAEANSIAQTLLSNAGFDTNVFKYNDLCILVSDTADLFRNYISSSNLSSQGKDIIISTISALDSLAKLEKDDYGIYKSIVVDKERIIIDNSTINTQEKVVLLSAMSVLRYSLYYWSKTENYLVDYNSTKKKMPKWLRVTVMAVADVAGGISGGVAGSVGGPVVIAAGGTVGAVAASNGAATLCDKIDQIIQDGNQSGNQSGN